MFSEILKILPRLDSNDLRKMERTLQSRFTRVAKSFGKGLSSIFTKGGPIGIALGFLTKLLNPLQEIQEAMERTLKTSDDIVTNAKQFGTTPGQLAKLTALGQASGLETDSLYMLINKFQGAVAQAEANPNQPSVVSNYVGQKDTAAGFFEFIQALQRMEKNDQIRVQEQVFGEKQILKMADFLSADFGELVKRVAPQPTEKIDRSVRRLADLNDKADELGAKRKLDDLITKGSTINSSMINSRDKAERAALDKENKQIASYESLNAISETMNKVEGLVQEGITQLGKLITVVTPKITTIVEKLEQFSKSPLLKGIFKFGKGD